MGAGGQGLGWILHWPRPRTSSAGLLGVGDALGWAGPLPVKLTGFLTNSWFGELSLGTNLLAAIPGAADLLGRQAGGREWRFCSGVGRLAGLAPHRRSRTPGPCGPGQLSLLRGCPQEWAMLCWSHGKWEAGEPSPKWVRGHPPTRSRRAPSPLHEGSKAADSRQRGALHGGHL